MYLANGASKKTEKKGPLEELILPFYFTNECTYTILHVKCLWISLGTKLLRSGKNRDTTLICYRKSFPKGEICKENVFL